LPGDAILNLIDLGKQDVDRMLLARTIHEAKWPGVITPISGNRRCINEAMRLVFEQRNC